MEHLITTKTVFSVASQKDKRALYMHYMITVIPKALVAQATQFTCRLTEDKNTINGIVVYAHCMVAVSLFGRAKRTI